MHHHWWHMRFKETILWAKCSKGIMCFSWCNTIHVLGDQALTSKKLYIHGYQSITSNSCVGVKGCYYLWRWLSHHLQNSTRPTWGFYTRFLPIYWLVYYLYWWLHSLVRENSYSYWARVCSWCNSFAFVLNKIFGIPIKIKKEKRRRKLATW